MKKINIYTDGACSGNPGPGGWGIVFKQEDKEWELSGAESSTTNNRMELMAVIKALESLPTVSVLKIHTDSKYVHDGVTLWLEQWKKNSWKTAAKKPVKNIDLWLQLEKALQDHTIQWQWVQGHAGDPGNEKADLLARKAIIRYQIQQEE
jgi:ribonuclease HI